MVEVQTQPTLQQERSSQRPLQFTFFLLICFIWFMQVRQSLASHGIPNLLYEVIHDHNIIGLVTTSTDYLTTHNPSSTSNSSTAGFVRQISNRSNANILNESSSSNGESAKHDNALVTNKDANLPTLRELVRSSDSAYITCPEGTDVIQDDIILDDNGNETSSNHAPAAAATSHRKIPKIIHMTSKTRCATPDLMANINKWRFQNYSFYFHDDDAVDRLFRIPHSQALFPRLNETLKCVTNGATKADLWRYLILYLYGGVYTDVDNLPVKFGSDTIQDSDDSFYPIESIGIVAQYFMASSAGHPLLYQTLNSGIESLRKIVNVMSNNPARNTGPHALKIGFIKFIQNHHGRTFDGYVTAGHYVGEENRTVTVVGTKENPKEYVDRRGLGPLSKEKYYKKLGIESFPIQTKKRQSRGRISCLEHLARTNGTNQVANYRFDETQRKYVDIVGLNE